MAAMIYELKYEISKVKQEIHDRNKAYKQIKFVSINTTIKLLSLVAHTYLPIFTHIIVIIYNYNIK